MFITEQMQYQQMLANYLEIPIFIQLMNGPAEGDLFFKSCEPPFHSTNYNLQREFMFKTQPESWFYFRLQNFVTILMQKSYLMWRMHAIFYE